MCTENNKLHIRCHFDRISHLSNSQDSSFMRHHRVTLYRVTFISSEEVPVLSVMKYFFVVSGTSCSLLINIKTRRNYKS